MKTPLDYVTDFFKAIKGVKVKAETNCLVYHANQTYWIVCWWHKKEKQEIISEINITLESLNGTYKVVKECLKSENSVFLYQLSSAVMQANSRLDLMEKLVSPTIHLIRLYKI